MFYKQFEHLHPIEQSKSLQPLISFPSISSRLTGSIAEAKGQMTSQIDASHEQR